MNSPTSALRVNGLKLNIHRFRDDEVKASGLTILLLHGFLDAGATWDRVAPELAIDGHEIFAPDLRGFGESDPIGAGGYYHFPDYVADVASIVDTYAPKRLAIVGHSMGGTIAAYYTGTFPEKVERLALLEGLGPVATEPHLAVDRMQAWIRDLNRVDRSPRKLSSLKEAVERLSLHHPRVAKDVIESRAKLLTRPDERGQLGWAYDSLHRTTAPMPFHAESFKCFLRRIDCPTLVVSGGPTGWHPPDEAERVGCLPHVTQWELPDAGHMMHWTEPQKLAKRLRAFFAEGPLKPYAKVPATNLPMPMSVGGMISDGPEESKRRPT